MKSRREMLLRLILMSIGAGAILVAFSGGHGLSPADRLLLVAGVAVVTSLLCLVPGDKGTPSLPRLLRPALAAGFLTLVLSTWQAPLPALLPILLKLSLGAALLTFAGAAMAHLATPRGQHVEGTTLFWVVALMLLAAGAPVWLGPLVDYPGAGSEVVNALVAVSPLSYLAVMAEWDYLRGDWFYRHSPIGGLRYSYPSALGASLFYGAAGLACHWLKLMIRNRGVLIDRELQTPINHP